MKRREDAGALVVLVGIWAAVVAVVGLGGDFALNDDWAYSGSARSLLHGHMRISDWAAPSLGSHALWGAGALQLLGDSYVSLRIGSLAWALLAQLAAYGLARMLLSPPASVAIALGLGLSPWFLNLSFTYMTEAHWIALMLWALLAFARAIDPEVARPPRAWLLLVSGALVGAAATTRQFAVITAPGFALALILEARLRGRRSGARQNASWISAARGVALHATPLGLVFGVFYRWYLHVHGPTAANRETVSKLLEVRPWHWFFHTMCTWHYVGLWLAPVALALAFQGRLRDAAKRRTAVVSVIFLGGYAIVRPLLGLVLEPKGQPFDHPEKALHALMPYLGNVFTLVGLGPPTFTDIYRDHMAAPLHQGLWLGALLTIVSTFGGVVAAGLLFTQVARVVAALRGRDASKDPHGDVIRAVLLGYVACYLGYHLGTATFIFDRYLLPALPAVLILGADAAAPLLSTAPESSRRLTRGIVAASLAVSGIFSVAATREYLSWAGARQAAVNALVARGVPLSTIDGGFEINGPVQFDAYLKRTGEKLGDNGYFWLEDARYIVSFTPSRHPDCRVVDRFPFWTWPGGGDHAVYSLDCRTPVGTTPR